ncbi:FAD-dependent oxidoreductase, partial [Falsiroseomonas oryzae]|uniref:FAD-dependent oxidoreductase n=1 Tax=Falsiroseomonas oryzae TaxID=2766473 RepID=UPI002FDBB303
MPGAGGWPAGAGLPDARARRAGGDGGMTYDVAVLGAGPAGMAAATEAARRGARAVLLEESPQPGGQVHRAAP